MSRRRPLHTVGASVLTIIHNACTRARELNGPVGSMTKRITTSMSSRLPFVYTMLYQWLAILSFIDDHILTLEYVVEKVFPPSIRLFDEIDRLVYDAECLPGKFDDAFNTFPKILHKFPYLDWTVEHLISWLNFLISTLTLWGLKSTKQKDIKVDASCKSPRTRFEMSIGKADPEKQNDELIPSIFKSDDSNPFLEMTPEVGKEEGCVREASLFPVLECLEDETKAAGSSSSPPTYINTNGNEMKSVGMKLGTDIIKCSYKEMLGKKTKEDMETEGDHHNNALVDSPRSTISEEKAEIDRETDLKKGTGRFNLNDPILELYDASWHLK